MILISFYFVFSIITHLTRYEAILILLQEEVLTVFDQIALSDREICGYLLGPTCEDAYDPYHQNWNISIPGNKPPVVPIPDPKVRLAKNNYCSTTCQATCI